MTDNENKPAAAQIQEWIGRVCQQVREDNAELARTGKDEKFYTFTLNEMNHLLPLLSVAKASAVPEQLSEQPSIDTPEFRELAHAMITAHERLDGWSGKQFIAYIDAKLNEANARADEWQHIALLASRESRTQKARAEKAEFSIGVIAEDVKYVADKFAKDLEQGYKTKDKEFASAILGRRLKIMDDEQLQGKSHYIRNIREEIESLEKRHVTEWDDETGEEKVQLVRLDQVLYILEKYE